MDGRRAARQLPKEIEIMAMFDRFEIVAAYYLIASRWHSGQWSKGYRKLCQADRMGFRPGVRFGEEKHSDERNAAAALLWQRRREIRREW